jgi:hypothetical protein
MGTVARVCESEKTQSLIPY